MQQDSRVIPAKDSRGKNKNSGGGSRTGRSVQQSSVQTADRISCTLWCQHHVNIMDQSSMHSRKERSSFGLTAGSSPHKDSQSDFHKASVVPVLCNVYTKRTSIAEARRLLLPTTTAVSTIQIVITIQQEVGTAGKTLQWH